MLNVCRGVHVCVCVCVRCTCVCRTGVGQECGCKMAALAGVPKKEWRWRMTGRRREEGKWDSLWSFLAQEDGSPEQSSRMEEGRRQDE